LLQAVDFSNNISARYLKPSRNGRTKQILKHKSRCSPNKAMRFDEGKLLVIIDMKWERLMMA